jgi:hypothetical protein
MTQPPHDQPGDEPDRDADDQGQRGPGGYGPQGGQYGAGQYGGQQYGGQQYGYPSAYPPAGGPYAPDHPKATTVLVLGILGVVVCQVLGPFAWVMGKRTVAEIDASGGRLGGRGSAQAGYVLGVVGTVLLGLSLLFLIGYVVLMGALIGGGMAAGAA